MASALLDRVQEVWQRDELPEELAWVKLLAPLHLRLFYVDLSNAWARYCATRDPSDAADLLEVLEEWEETATLDSAEDISRFLLSEKSDQEYDLWPMGD